MFSYLTYGLAIRSFMHFPELIPAEVSRENVSVRLGRVDGYPTEKIARAQFSAARGEACIGYEDVGSFLVRDGREIVVDPAPGVEESVLRLFILGPVMAVLLHQRGLLVLHASAVAVDGRAIAFIGRSGQGKSTTAAVMHARGHELLADDGVAVVFDPTEEPNVLPGFPQFKLWPDAVLSLGADPATLPRVHPKFEKRAQRLRHGFSRVPAALRAIYVLTDAPRHETQVLDPQEGFVELLRHSKTSRLLGGRSDVSAHFRRCAKLASRVPICRLSMPRSLSTLPDLADVVEKDVEKSLPLNVLGASATTRIRRLETR